MRKPTWTDIATEEQPFRVFRRSCETIQGKHSRAVSTCDPTNDERNKIDGGSCFVEFESYAEGEYNRLVAGVHAALSLLSPPSSLLIHLGAHLTACKMLIEWASVVRDVGPRRYKIYHHWVETNKSLIRTAAGLVYLLRLVCHLGSINEQSSIFIRLVSQVIWFHDLM